MPDKDVVITFANKATHSPGTKLVFKQGETTRTIDLPGAARKITSIELVYGNLAGGGKASVEIYGRTKGPK